MISDEPDEDAGDLDDEAMLDNLVDGHSSKQKESADALATLVDWPGRSTTEVGLNLDPETLAWFKSTYVNWRQQMAFVLRAWVTATAVQRPSS